MCVMVKAPMKVLQIVSNWSPLILQVLIIAILIYRALARDHSACFCQDLRLTKLPFHLLSRTDSGSTASSASGSDTEDSSAPGRGQVGNSTFIASV